MTSLPREEVSPVALVVDDEPMLLKVVALTLRREGFTIVEAVDGNAALEILKSDKPLDVLLTDVRMPGLNGYQLAAQSLSIRPQLPVILMTGFTDEEMPDALRRASLPLLRKPFDFAALGSSLRRVIAGESPQE